MVNGAFAAGAILFPGSGALAAATQAVSADAFVDSIGVNTHISYTRTPYWSRWDDTKSALTALGVRHFRDGVFDCTNHSLREFCVHFAELGAAGLTGDFVAGLKIPMSVVTVFPTQVGSAFGTFEGPNEYDLSRDPNWFADLAAYQQQLYTTVKSDPAIAKYGVVGPPIGHLGNYAHTTDLSAYFDFGNLHDYPGTSNPGTRDNSPIRRWADAARSLNGGKPNVATETGYWDGPPDKPLPAAVMPDAIIARYEPRLFLEQHKEGIVRTYQYEFIDEGGDVTSVYDHGGLLTNDLTPKPQYFALRNLIALLRDPGPSFSPGTLDYELSGSTDRVEHSLFAKRDGSMYIAIWLEKLSYDVGQRRDRNVKPQAVQLTIHGSTDNAATVTFDDNGRTTRAPLAFHGGAASLSIGDHVVVVCLPK